MHRTTDLDQDSPRPATPSRVGATCRGAHARRLAVVVLVLGPALLVGCSSELPTASDEDERTLLVWGYVLARGNPARGGAGLIDPAGFVVATTPVETGRYLIGLELPPGTRVCDGYRVRVAVEVGRSSEVEEQVLEADSGDCVVPTEAKARHTMDFFFPADTTQAPGATP